MFVKLFNKIVESEAIFKVKKANIKVNLSIVKFTVSLKQTFNKISNE